MAGLVGIVKPALRSLKRALIAARNRLYYRCVTIPANVRAHPRKVTKLLVVAHPDDETLFFCRRLMESTGWLVVCLTNGDNPVRAASLRRVARSLNFRSIILDFPDGNEVVWNTERARSVVAPIIGVQSWEAILTHNEQGEYGHLQHRQVHALVAGLCTPGILEVPAPEEELLREEWWLPEPVLERKRELLATCYRSEQSRLARLETYIVHEHLVRVELVGQPRAR